MHEIKDVNFSKILNFFLYFFTKFSVFTEIKTKNHDFHVFL